MKIIIGIGDDREKKLVNSEFQNLFFPIIKTLEEAFPEFKKLSQIEIPEDFQKTVRKYLKNPEYLSRRQNVKVEAKLIKCDSN